MMGYILIAGAILLVLVLRIALGRITDLPVPPRWARVLFVMLAAGSAAMTIIEAGNLTEANQSKEWPEVTAIIVSSEVVGERAIRPEITYRYTVGSVEYENSSDLKVPMFGGKRKKYDVAHELTQRYGVGDTVTARYNPEKHAISVLTPGAPWSIYGRLASAFTLIVCGLGGMSLPQRNRNQAVT